MRCDRAWLVGVESSKRRDSEVGHVDSGGGLTYRGSCGHGDGGRFSSQFFVALLLDQGRPR